MKAIISKLGRFAALQAVVLAGLFAISSANAEEGKFPAHPKPLWAETASDAQIAKDARRDPNKYCVDCHGSLSAFEHAGKHFQHGTVSPNNGKELNCTTCHGNISENHRKGVKDVMRFNAYGKAKNPDLERSPQEQNAVCFACHNPDKLREKFWAHDTHAPKIACVNCHKLHPETEPMKATAPKDRIKLCVDCHSKVHQNKLKAGSEGTKETK